MTPPNHHPYCASPHHPPFPTDPIQSGLVLGVIRSFPFLDPGNPPARSPRILRAGLAVWMDGWMDERVEKYFKDVYHACVASELELDC